MSLRGKSCESCDCLSVRLLLCLFVFVLCLSPVSVFSSASLCLPVCLSFVSLSVCLLLCLIVCPLYVSCVCLRFLLPLCVCPSVCLLLLLFVSRFYLFFCLFVSVRVSVPYICQCLSVALSVCLTVCFYYFFILCFECVYDSHLFFFTVSVFDCDYRYRRRYISSMHAEYIRISIRERRYTWNKKAHPEINANTHINNH